MDYSERVNSKKGAGGIADLQESNVHTKRRIRELLTTQVLDLDNDPYVYRNHLGLLECKLCLTTHVSESSYISHLGGRKHQMNLEKRRLLDERLNKKQVPSSKVISISNTPKRKWTKIGVPEYTTTKVRNPDTLRMGILFHIKYPRSIQEPFFRLMSYFELNDKAQQKGTSYLDEEEDASKWQYLVFSAEPYENVCFVIPNDKIEGEEMSPNFWWYWDRDTKDYYLQILFNVDE